MIVKDFLLSLDREKLCKTYYEMYDAKDEVAQAEAKEGGYDLEERVTQCIHHCLDQFKDVEPVATPNEYMMVVKYYDFDMTDDLEMVEVSTLDPHLLNVAETKNRGKLTHITSMDERPDGLVWSSYSTMLLSWEKLLGYEICYLDGDEYEAAASILFEVTFFGWDKERYEQRVQDVEDDLEESHREIEEGTADFVKYEEETFCKEFNLPIPTPEEKEREREFMFKQAVKNYNIQVDIYNKLLDMGIIQ